MTISPALARHMQLILSNKTKAEKEKASKWAALEAIYGKKMATEDEPDRTMRQRNAARLLKEIHTRRAQEADERFAMWASIEKRRCGVV